MSKSIPNLKIDARFDGLDALAHAIRALGYNVPDPDSYIMANASTMRLDNLGLVVPVPSEWYDVDQEAKREMTTPNDE